MNRDGISCLTTGCNLDKCTGQDLTLLWKSTVEGSKTIHVPPAFGLEGPGVDVIPGWIFRMGSGKEFVWQGYGAGVTDSPAGSFEKIGRGIDADELCRFEESVENSRDLGSSFGF